MRSMRQILLSLAAIICSVNAQGATIITAFGSSEEFGMIRRFYVCPTRAEVYQIRYSTEELAASNQISDVPAYTLQTISCVESTNIAVRTVFRE
jgi:hypothetical protein